MSNTTPDPNVRTQLQQFGQELKQELQSANIGDDVKQQLGTKIDQKLDELGAKIGGGATA
jgi:hypothetical protein